MASSSANTPAGASAGARYYNLNSDELEEYEEQASTASSAQQDAALLHVAGVLERNGIPHGVMGGYNFWTRGNTRRTDDVDVAVSLDRELADIMNLFNDDPLITRPAQNARMLWIQGIARIFVNIDGQLVQIDLKGKRAEGQGIPRNLAANVTRLPLRDISHRAVNFFNILSLVRAKFLAMRRRDAAADYDDVLFLCLDERWRVELRAVAEDLDIDERLAFLARVMLTDLRDEQAVRWALRLDEDQQEQQGTGKTPPPSDGPPRPGPKKRKDDEDGNGKGKGKGKKKTGFWGQVFGRSSKKDKKAAGSSSAGGTTGGRKSGTETRGITAEKGAEKKSSWLPFRSRKKSKT